MAEPREARLTFGEDPHAYDRARPSYPAAVIDRIVDLGDLSAGCEVVEVGAGTGIATALLVARGLSVTAIEPDPAMAAVLTDRQIPGVRVVVAGFEEWRPDGTARAVVSAQAWHWLDQAEAPKHAARASAPAAGWL